MSKYLACHSINNHSLSFCLPAAIEVWHWGSWEGSQVADTPRDSCLQFRTVGCGAWSALHGLGDVSHRILCLQTSETDSGWCQQSTINCKDTRRSQHGQQVGKAWKQIETKVLSCGRPGGRDNRHNLRAHVLWSGLLGCDRWSPPTSTGVSRQHLDASMCHTPLPCEKEAPWGPFGFIVGGLVPGSIA